jgi:VanZ family protein
MKYLKWPLRALPIAYMALIWFMSSLPSDQFVKLPDSSVDAFMKESLHLVEFAILYVLLVVACLTFRKKFTVMMNVSCALLAVLYGITDEIHQSFFPYRSATVIDFVKDTLGVSVCYYFVDGALFKGKFGSLRVVLGKIRG